MSDKYVQIKEKVNTTQNGVFYNQLDKFQTNKLFFVLSALNLQNNNVNIYIYKHIHKGILLFFYFKIFMLKVTVKL